MKVYLAHASNPDIPGGYWPDGNPSAKCGYAEVKTIVDASKTCRQYIEKNGLGGGNWIGGQVFQDKKQVAYISYNGRAWNPNAIGKKELIQ